MRKKLAVIMMTTVAMATMAITAFAEEVTPVINPEMLAPIKTSILDTIATVLPWGMGIIAIMIGINFAIKFVKKFAKGA